MYEAFIISTAASNHVQDAGVNMLYMCTVNVIDTTCAFVHVWMAARNTTFTI